MRLGVNEVDRSQNLKATLTNLGMLILSANLKSRAAPEAITGVGWGLCCSTAKATGFILVVG
jgi:hypothetical protein